jgi:hypothetical protein
MLVDLPYRGVETQDDAKFSSDRATTAIKSTSSMQMSCNYDPLRGTASLRVNEIRQGLTRVFASRCPAPTTNRSRRTNPLRCS